MSSAIDGQTESPQNGTLRESPGSRGFTGSVLVELSSNTTRAHHCELFHLDDTNNSNNIHLGKKGKGVQCDERTTSHESPTRVPTPRPQTHPSFLNNTDDQMNVHLYDSDTENQPTSNGGQGQDLALRNDENEKCNSSLPAVHITSKSISTSPLAGDRTPPPLDSKPCSDPGNDGVNGEYQTLIQKHSDDNCRPSPFKSILKKSCVSGTGKPSPSGDVTTCISSHDSPDQQHVTFHEMELPKMVDQPSHSSLDHKGAYSFVVSMPLNCQVERKMSRKHIAQLAAMSGCGFILVSLILAWVFSPTFL